MAGTYIRTEKHRALARANNTGSKNHNFGKHHSEEHKRKLSEATKGERSNNFGKHPSEETLAKMRAIKIGKKHSEASKQKMSKSRSGNKNHNFGKHLSEETKEKLRIAGFERRHSKETKEKIRIAGIGRKCSEETKEKLRIVNANQIVTEEMRKKMSIAKLGKTIPEKICINMSMSRQGITNPADWKGYVKKTPYCELFTSEFKERQYSYMNYTCILCEKRIPHPESHHVYEQKASCCQSIDETGEFFMIRNQKFHPDILPMIDKDKELEYGLNKFAVLCKKCHGKVRGRLNGKTVFEYIRELEKIINEKYKGRSYYTREEYWGNGYYYKNNEIEQYYDAITGELYSKHLNKFQGWGLPKKSR